MRKPPARKIAILLIVLAILTVFIVDSIQQGITVFHSIGLFFDRIAKSVRSWNEMGNMGDKNEYMLMLLALAFLICVILTPYGRREIKRFFNSREPDEDYYQKDKELYREQITLEGLSPYEPLLKSLAKDAGIREVVFRYNDEVEIIRTIERPGYVPIIEIGNGFFSGLSRACEITMREQFMRFSIFHELTHVKHHDPMNTIWLRVISIIVWLFGFIVIGFSSVAPALRLLLLFIWIVFISALARNGYWSQCAEYRADIEALALLSMSGDDIDSLYYTFSRCFPKMVDEKKVGIKTTMVYLLKVMKGSAATSDADAHPSLQQRMVYAKKYKKWTIISYVDGAIQVMRSVISSGT